MILLHPYLSQLGKLSDANSPSKGEFRMSLRIFHLSEFASIVHAFVLHVSFISDTKTGTKISLCLLKYMDIDSEFTLVIVLMKTILKYSLLYK